MRKREIILGALFILPVSAAHYFNLEGSFLTTVSALISVGLWVVFITRASATIANNFLRTAASLALATILALYFFGQFISYYLQGSYYNAQFFFHMNLSTLTETWQVFNHLVFLFIGWLVCIWFTVFWTRNRPVRKTKSGFVVLLILLLAIAFDPGLRTSSASAALALLDQKDESLDSIEWEQLQLDRRALHSDTGPALPGKNLVMVFLEGFERLYTDPSVFPNLTPNILALNNQGWQLENLSQLNGTGWTMAGLVSSMCGTPLLFESGIGRNNIMFTDFLDRAVCLPDILRSAGYNQTFLGGASLEFGGKGNFFEQHSYDQVHGRSGLSERLPDPTYLGKWGLFDDSLFDLAVQEFERLSEKTEPFNLTLLTVDTHHPSGEASRSCPKYGEIDNSILHAVHCTDYLVGRFVERLQSIPAYSDTLVVLMSDHLAMRNNAFPLFPQDYERRLYFNVLNSGLKGSSAVSATPMDVAPTILNLLGVQHNSTFLAGEDISSMPDGSPRYRVGNPRRNRTIAFLNSNYLTSSSRSKGRSIHIDLDDCVFRKDVVDVESSSNGVTFTASGRESFIVLPKFRNASGGPISLVIDFEAPGDTMLSVFFVTAEDQNYLSNVPRKQQIKAGNNRVVLPLPANADSGRIRINPGAIEGEYTVHSIEIQL
jgi:phosphoglycerol transferase